MTAAARTYRYLFFRLYAWGRRAHGLRDLPEYNAILGLSMLAAMNVLSTLMAVELVLGLEVLVQDARIAALGLWLAFLVVHYFALVHGGRTDRIVAEFDERDDGSGSLVWLYPAMSVAAFLALLSARWIQ